MDQTQGSNVGEQPCDQYQNKNIHVDLLDQVQVRPDSLLKEKTQDTQHGLGVRLR